MNYSAYASVAYLNQTENSDEIDDTTSDEATEASVEGFGDDDETSQEIPAEENEGVAGALDQLDEDEEDV